MEDRELAEQSGPFYRKSELPKLHGQSVRWRAGKVTELGPIEWRGSAQPREGEFCCNGVRYTVDHPDARYWFSPKHYDELTGAFRAHGAVLQIIKPVEGEGSI